MNSQVSPIAFRLARGADLKQSVLASVQSNNIQAGCIASVVGCLSRLSLRLADGHSVVTIDGAYEIIAVSGTLTPEHVHLHLSAADSEGKMIGGHLMEGSIVSHTAEVCLLSFPAMAFTREYDDDTGYTELVVS
ncbi:PPC domain-containing DNA-binding protein [Enterovibrio norvegicus]|uniref:DNA-binding protein n=1 Tax=Enterovibrio norvegicus TaxID=188144 RepID=A0A2N7L4G5_9GAMM|nr:PPC domain-containing DNA-binding protein [Enterovibrio norvegicus]PMN88223.1 DNA-binding protein [Enterovibrio norvegicus]